MAISIVLLLGIGLLIVTLPIVAIYPTNWGYGTIYLSLGLMGVGAVLTWRPARQ